MLRDWQLSNPTGSLLKRISHCVSKAKEGHGPPSRSYFIFCREDAFFYARFIASAAITNRRRQNKKILQSLGRLGRPQLRVETSSSARSALVCPVRACFALG